MTPTLLLTDRLPWLWRLLGVNYGQMRAILAVKLQLDNRRPAVFNQGKKAGESTNTYWISLAIYAVFGLVFSMYLATAPPTALVLPAALFFGYILVICLMSLISDFSSVILDSSDNQILLFRPVDGRTVLMARVVHVASYLFTIALAVGVFGILTVGYRFGSGAGLLTLMLCLLMAVLAVFLTTLTYLLLMQVVSNERLREGINYMQIGMAIFFYGGYQLLPRLMGTERLRGSQVLVWQNWHYLVPPLWSAGSLDMVVNGLFDTRHWLLLTLALTTPFLGIYLMLTVLAPVFTRKLAGMDQAETADSALPRRPTRPGTLPVATLSNRLSNWFTSNALERAGFRFVWHLTGRDRKFKLRTYPGLGFGLAYAVVMSLNQKSSLGQSDGFYLFILYFGGIYLLTAAMQLAVSDDYKAAWIFESAPVERPGWLLSGGLKALIVKLMLPYYALLSAYVLYLKGPLVIPTILLALVNILAMVLIALLMGKRQLPFTVAQDTMRQNATARMFASMAIGGLIGFGHWGLTFLPNAEWLALAVMFLAVFQLVRAYQRTQWSQIEA